MRTRRVSACRGDVSTYELLIEDGAASHALRDDDTGPVVADLCATCGAEYANRVATVGCTVCSSRLALGLTAEYDPEFGGYCGGCAVEAATTSVRSELNDACAIAVSNAITPLRERLDELTPLREQNVAFAMQIEELERLQAEADEEHRDLRQAFELLERQTPASPAAPLLDMGPDRRAPKFDRCGEELGVGFASYTITGADGLPKSVALQEASPALAELVAGGRMTVQVLLRDGSTPTAMTDYYYFDAQVRGVAVETGGAGIELYVSATGLRYVLPVVDFSSWEFGPSVASAWPEVTRHGMDRTAPNLAVADGQSVVDASIIDPGLLRSASMYSARLRGAPVGVPPQLALHAAARAPSAAPVGGVDWGVGGTRHLPPGPAARLGLVPEALSFLSRPEVRGDVDCHGNSFVAPAPTEEEAEKDDGDGEWAAAGIFPYRMRRIWSARWLLSPTKGARSRLVLRRRRRVSLRFSTRAYWRDPLSLEQSRRRLGRLARGPTWCASRPPVSTPSLAGRRCPTASRA